MDKRSPNFTSSEVEYLVSAVKKWRHIIECKRSDHTSTEDKLKAWKEIEREFNCKYTHTFRSHKVLKTKYGNLKSVSKQNFAADKRATYATGGGCAQPKTATTIDESILEICQVGQVLGNKSLFDGDADDDCAEVMEDDCDFAVEVLDEECGDECCSVECVEETKDAKVSSMLLDEKCNRFTEKMWRNVITTLQRSVAITPRRCINNNSQLKWNSYIANVAIKNKPRSLVSTATRRNSEENTDAEPFEGYPEYIIPYKSEYERSPTVKLLVDTLSTRFRLTDRDIQHIIKDPIVAKSKKKSLIGALEILLMEGINKKSFIQYPWIMTLNEASLIPKIQLIKLISGSNNCNDFVPFLRVPEQRLRYLVTSLKKEAPLLNSENRIFYIAEKLKVPLSLVSKYLSNRLFVLEMPLGVFKVILESMIKYNIEPLSVLKDLWAFRYTPRAVELRLLRAQQAKKDKLMPWMIRCPEPVLQKSLQQSLNELKVLDDKSTVAEYIGERLGFSPEEAQVIMDKHPQVNTVRVTKVKEVLDYLLNEAQFSRHEIAQVPRVLCHSLKTTKKRLEELKQLNCRPSSLVIVCRSKREYAKFLNAWKDCNSYKTLEKNNEGDKVIQR